MNYSFYYPPENKVIVARNAEFFNISLITQEVRGSLEDLELIQEEDTHPFENTSLHHDKDEQEIVKPESDHELGDHNELTNYKDALSNSKSEKWLEVMNVEMQSMKDNQVWDLLNLPLNVKTVA
ncbi:hypothetical protein Tco_0006696 [Tanacetum coccineum]